MDRLGPSGKDLIDLLRGRPGWRLEPSSTPGSEPQWSFVVDGRVEFSAVREGESIRLYVMGTDDEIVFGDADELATWLRTYRSAAMQDRAPQPSRKSRFRKLFEWS